MAAAAAMQVCKQSGAGAEVAWGLGIAAERGTAERVAAATIADLERECMSNISKELVGAERSFTNASLKAAMLQCLGWRKEKLHKPSCDPRYVVAIFDAQGSYQPPLCRETISRG
ncbi:hypothetical protein CLCR_06436 [Cladophialophora carrionii]|uniref:Uncharacterized protein n=1 Tax=Cladophialophora carrionii TaxID=86049 RepID=A0A1C1C7I3_9EURO|nr:hypothetical protein CLCR_06436 [Cladophialophora carrionii]